MATLIAKEISKTYKQRSIVHHVSLEINTGEVVGLLGPNGAGKTTCFYMLVGLIQPDSGKILLNKQNITHTNIDDRAQLRISYLPQESSVFRRLTVAENIMAILELRADLNATERKDYLEKLLDEFNLLPIRHYLGQSLSGGERRRTEIARSLATSPQFILLDEPFAGVDPISISDIKTMILHLQQKQIGVLITDHNVRETLDICQRAYILNQGEILCEGSPKIIMNNQQVRQVYLGDDFHASTS